MCYKDTEAKLYVITDVALVVPPPPNDAEEATQEFEEKQQDFLKKWKTPVENAFRKRHPKVIYKKTRKNTGISLLFAGSESLHPGHGRRRGGRLEPVLIRGNLVQKFKRSLI